MEARLPKKGTVSLAEFWVALGKLGRHFRSFHEATGNLTFWW